MLPFQPNPDAVAPSDVRIIHLSIQPWEDNKRIKVFIELTPFLNPPNLEIEILDHEGNVISSTNIIETILSKLVFTMHMRQLDPTNRYTVSVIVGYEGIGMVSNASYNFVLE